MRAVRAVMAVALADFRERTRRESFLVAVVLVGWVAYAVAAGQIALRFGGYQGVMNAAWLGGLLTLVVSTSLGFMGFFLISNAIDLDRRMGVGEVLAASPVSRLQYVVAKWLSSFAMLAVLVGVLMIASVLLHWRDMQRLSVELPSLLTPMVIVAVPAMALTAACAVLFESVFFLRGVVGTVVWLVGFAASISRAGSDFTGFHFLGSSMEQAAKSQLPAYQGGFALQILPQQPLRGFFQWAGADWPAPMVMQRVEWALAAVPLVVLAAVCFDRFQTGAVAFAGRRRAVQQPAAAAAAERPYQPAGTVPAPVMRLSMKFRIGVELRLLLTGAGRLWQAVALGIAAGSFFADPAIARGLLVAAWIWPVLRWSQMGCREAQEGTGEIVFACSHPVLMQLPAQWLAGFLLAAAMGGGVLLRFIVLGETGSVLTWLAAAAFIPSLALMLGVLSGRAKVFEVVYLMLCYAGPMSGVAGLDFMAARTPGAPAVWFGCAAVSLAIAMLWRWRQLNH